MQQHGSTHFAHRLPQPPPPTLEVKMSKFNFLEYGPVAYQIEENHECSNMVANILPAEPPAPPTLGMGSIGQNSTFSEHGYVVYQIKGNHEMQLHGSKHFACRPPYFSPTPLPWDRVHRSKFNFFQNMVMLHIKLSDISKCTNMVANVLPADSPSPTTLGDRVKKS